MDLQKFKTLLDLLVYFKDEQVCRDYLELVRWNGNLEGYWSLLKRGVVGIYHSMSAKHLQLYLDEFSFRYNTRKLSECDRFNFMLGNISAQLPYKKLIENEQRKQYTTVESVDHNRWLEAKQGTFSF